MVSSKTENVKRLGTTIGITYILIGSLAFLISLFTDIVPPLNEWALQHEFTAINLLVVVSAGLVTLMLTNPPETSCIAALASSSGYKVSPKERILLEEDAISRSKVVFIVAPVYVALSLIVTYLLPQLEFVNDEVYVMPVTGTKLLPLRMTSLFMAMFHSAAIWFLTIPIQHSISMRNFPELKPLKRKVKDVMLRKKSGAAKRMESEETSKTTSSTAKSRLMLYSLWASTSNPLALKWDQLGESSESRTKLEAKFFVEGSRTLIVAIASFWVAPSLIALAAASFLMMKPADIYSAPAGNLALSSLPSAMFTAGCLLLFAIFIMKLRHLPGYHTGDSRVTKKDFSSRMPISKWMQNGFTTAMIMDMFGFVILFSGVLVRPYNAISSIISLVSGSIITSLSFVALSLERRYARRVLGHFREQK